MDTENPQTSLIEFNELLSSKSSTKCPSYVNRKQFISDDYENSTLATPILRPIQNKIDIPPLDSLPNAAIPMRSDKLFNLSEDSRLESFHLSPNIETKLEKLQVTLVKKNTTDGKPTIATPDMARLNVSNCEIQSMSTLASSNKLSKCSDEIEMVFEDEHAEGASKKQLFKSDKGPQSKERKLSNEEGVMLPPSATSGVLLRPSKFVSNPTITSKSGNKDQQALKPMTILGFLKESCSDCLLQVPRKEELEKADTSLPKNRLLSGTMSKAGANIPAFTLG